MSIFGKVNIEKSYVGEMMNCLIENNDEKLQENCTDALNFHKNRGLTHAEASILVKNMTETAKEFAFGED